MAKGQSTIQSNQSSASFAGFTKQTLGFLRKLKKNNNREWFQQHKDAYLEQVRHPLELLIQDLAAANRPMLKSIVFNPKKNIFRINRDVRFSNDKSPFKTVIAAHFEAPHIKRFEPTPGLYLQIGPGEIFMGGGMYMPSSVQIRKIRQSIVDDPEAFLEVVRAPLFKKRFKGLYGEKLKTKPKGIPADHPMIEFLRHKHFIAIRNYSEADILEKKFIKTLIADFEAAMPLIQWLNKAEKLW